MHCNGWHGRQGRFGVGKQRMARLRLAGDAGRCSMGAATQGPAGTARAMGGVWQCKAGTDLFG
jgi:hypothetical protein